MRDLRAFLRRHIEAFLEHEFGEATKQNMTPPGCRRLVWTSEHTQRLVDHLAGNWAPVEAAPITHPVPAPKHDGFHQVVCDYCPVTFGCGCPTLGGPHMCMGCDTAAEESKRVAPALRPPDRLGRKAP